VHEYSVFGRLLQNDNTEDSIVNHGEVGTDTQLLSKPFSEESLIRKVREVLDAEGVPLPIARALLTLAGAKSSGVCHEWLVENMKRLLIVDDDEATRRLFRLNLSDNYEIIDTADPDQALALAMEHKPDAILMDLRMPKHSGLDLCRAFGSISLAQPIPIYLVSGETGAGIKQSCTEMGAAGYFEKPVDFDALRTTLGKVRSQTQIPRNEIRLQLRVQIKLQGKDSLGKEFNESTFTENVSVSAFICECVADLPKDSIVDIHIVSGTDRYVGRARMVRSEQRPKASTLYAFRFLEKKGEWILQ
jgi:CheY-like chemotaxis protein